MEPATAATPTSHDDDDDPSGWTLLEQLRRNLVVLRPETEDERRIKAELMIQHRLEFPQTFRRFLDAAAALLPGHPPEDSPQSRTEFFFDCVQRSAFRHAWGRFRDGSNWSPDWRGLDDSLDTPDQAEVFFRIFPALLGNIFPVGNLHPVRSRERKNFFVRPVDLLITHERAISFVPLAAKIGMEGIDGDRAFREDLEDGLVRPNGLGVFKLLVVNKIAGRFVQRSTGTKPTPNERERIDQASWQAFVQLAELGLLEPHGNALLYDLLRWLFAQSGSRGRDFVKLRLRWFIDRNPGLLDDAGTTLLERYTCRWTRPPRQTLDPEHFGLILEAGLDHRPGALGYAFHGQTLRVAADRWVGTAAVSDVVLGKIRRHFSDSDASWRARVVVAAATNERVSLDGVYLLVRSDPLALLRPA